MTAVETDFMPAGRQLFGLAPGEALAEIARQKYTSAKQLARAWGIDPTTAANVFKGHLSAPTLAKAVAAEGWGLWEALGTTLTGETYEQYEERKLQSIIEQAENARENLVRLRARRAALAERADQLDGIPSRSAL